MSLDVEYRRGYRARAVLDMHRIAHPWSLLLMPEQYIAYDDGWLDADADIAACGRRPVLEPECARCGA